eukprot:TRINITY_DN2476_c0_g1_i1.p1 TRINITY_DN2476_c0_g1~~TRINITY_DN2476_c0_g1_i1.p1  ORF type:complete len:233 (-),score=77.39 TRINITY_DN2476_c0_g1_i1:164-862(-)
MGQIFSKKKNVITDVDKAVLTLKTQRKKLADYQKKVEAVISRETEVARSLIQANKRDRAMLALKRKRMQEDMLKKADVWMLNVEQQLVDIESATRQKDVFDSMKAGHAAIKELQRHISLEDVQMLMDDSVDAQEYQKEIESTLQGQLSEEDEAAVLAELDSLEVELGMDGLDDLPEVPLPAEKTKPAEEAEELELPSVPTKAVVVTTAEAEEEEERPQATEVGRRREEPLAA